MIFRKTMPPSDPPRPLDGHRTLLVADQGAPTPSLCRLLEERCQRGPCELHVLVSRLGHPVLVSDPVLGSPTDGDGEIRVDEQAYDVAEARLDSFMRALGDLGQPLTGQILGGNFRRQVCRLLKVESFDEVVVMTSSRGVRWPRRDLVGGIRRTCRVPVTAVAADDLAF